MTISFVLKLRLPVFAAACALAWFGETAAVARALSGATVAPDGTGDFATVQQAVNVAPEGGTRVFVIRLKPGRYREKLLVPKGKGPLRLRGDDAAGTVITYDDHPETPGADGQKLGTVRSASITVLADQFSAENVTFANSFGPGSQAVAINVFCEHAMFRHCRFLGWQDTLLLKGGTQSFEDCRIEGSVDFIFGAGTAFFERCELHCLARGAITAASTPEGHAYGFVFSHCKISTEPEVRQTFLGRPWRPFASVVYLWTEMPAAIAPAGWLEWVNAPERDKTARYAEFRNTGPGGDAAGRVAWSRQLGEAEAVALTADKVLGWTPTFDEAPAVAAEVVRGLGLLGDPVGGKIFRKRARLAGKIGSKRNFGK